MTDISTLSQREAAIFHRLQDDLSKELFLSRKRHSDAGLSLFYPLDFTVPQAAHFVEELDDLLRDKKFVLYGYGGGGQTFLDCVQFYRSDLLKGLVEIWDGNPQKQGKSVGELTITTPPTDCYQKNIDLVIISPISPSNCDAMMRICIGAGIDESKILLYQSTVLQHFDDQYFDEAIVQFGDDEIFIDGGSFDFSSSLEFIKRCPNPKKIYAYEPDHNVLPFVQRNAEKCVYHTQVECAALWSENTFLHFDNDCAASSSSVTSNKTSTLVKAVSLDRVIPLEEKVTFIKLDIEGSELEALKGAAQMIRRDRPKLAICIYHKPFDYVEIPEWIAGLVPEYRFYIRHYSITGAETVLYCIL